MPVAARIPDQPMAHRNIWRVHHGLEHGLYCVGCCWALLLLLFVGGVMNVTVIAALTAFVMAAAKMMAGGP